MTLVTRYPIAMSALFAAAFLDLVAHYAPRAPATITVPLALPIEAATVTLPPTDRECMALAAFTEARSEGAAGMAAVVEVVLNRLPFYANACEVVFARSQFLGVAGWTPRGAERADSTAWQTALALADAALAGSAMVPPACRGATSFNQARSAPRLRVLCRIGVHTFYTTH